MQTNQLQKSISIAIQTLRHNGWHSASDLRAASFFVVAVKMLNAVAVRIVAAADAGATLSSHEHDVNLNNDARNAFARLKNGKLFH